jgi:hypothetical protein
MHSDGEVMDWNKQAHVSTNEADQSGRSLLTRLKYSACHSSRQIGEMLRMVDASMHPLRFLVVQ